MSEKNRRVRSNKSPHDIGSGRSSLSVSGSQEGPREEITTQRQSGHHLALRVKLQDTVDVRREAKIKSRVPQTPRLNWVTGLRVIMELVGQMQPGGGICQEPVCPGSGRGLSFTRSKEVFL